MSEDVRDAMREVEREAARLERVVETTLLPHRAERASERAAYLRGLIAQAYAAA
jgi:hypothetical protein